MTTPGPTTRATTPRAALGRCVGDVPSFFERNWAQRPGLWAGVDSGAFADLFSLDAVDTLLSSLPRLPELRLVRDGKPIDPTRYSRTRTVGGQTVAGIADAHRISGEFAGGATIVFQSLQRTWPPLADFCRRLELELTHPVQANAYVTPAGERGLGVHHDTHDVFVLHLFGRKRWQVYEPVIERPLPDQRWSAAEAPTALVLDTELGPGDCLYLPRGYPHAAWSDGDFAAHLTVGVLSFGVQDVVAELVRRSRGEVGLRRSLPPGFAEDGDGLASEVAEVIGQLREWLATVDAAEVGRAVANRFWSTRPPVVPGQVRAVLGLDRVQEASTVRRRPTAVCRLSTGDGAVLVAVLGERRLEMPAELEPVVRRLAGGGPVCLADLDDLIDGKSRVVLARRLIREGVLELLE